MFMNKFTSTFSLLLLIETSIVVNAHALRTAHRPWMARTQEVSSPALEPDRTSRAPQHARHRHSAGAPHKGEKIAKQAIRYKGTKYRFGGDSKSKGFDCSGLVRRIYNDLHLDKVPHSAGGLYRMGHPIHLNELRAGDLVFFKNT